MASVSWQYPRDELIALHRQNEKARQAATLVVDTRLRIDNLRFRYRITGDDPHWWPVRVFDDTKKVYIQFPTQLDHGDASEEFAWKP